MLKVNEKKDVAIWSASPDTKELEARESLSLRSAIFFEMTIKQGWLETNVI